MSCRLSCLLERIFTLCAAPSALVPNLFYLCLFVPLSWYAYRSYHKGSNNSFFANIPKGQQRGMEIVGIVIFICGAGLEIVLGSLKVSDGRLSHFAAASVWLVLGADKWRHYLS